MLGVLASAISNVYLFADTAGSCSQSFLTFKTWFYYLPSSDFSAGCTITDFNALGAHSGFLLIALALLDDLIRLAAIIAVGYTIYGGFQYITSQGSPDMTKKAQETIINALIGLVVAIIAASVVAFIGNKLGS